MCIDAKLILVPESTLTRIKYWLNEYPIVLQNVEILDKQITNKNKLIIYKSIVRSTMTYGAEIWNLKRKESSKLLSTEMDF